MTTKLFNTLFDEVLSELASVPQPLALNAIRNAAIELCERSMIWTATAASINSVANQATYTPIPEANTEIIGVLQAWYNGLEIFPKTFAQLEDLLSDPGTTYIAGTPWTAQSGIPKYYTVERPDQIILAPYPLDAITAVIVLKVIQKPTRAATGMEQWIMDKYFMELAAGAKSHLCAMPGKPWSSPELVSYYGNKFEQGIVAASVKSSGTYKLPEMVTAPSPI